MPLVIIMYYNFFIPIARSDLLSVKNPQDSYGEAKLDMSDLLRGLQVIEFTLPVVNLPGYEHLMDDGSGKRITHRNGGLGQVLILALICRLSERNSSWRLFEE